MEDLQQQLERELEEHAIKEERERERLEQSNRQKMEELNRYYNEKYVAIKNALQKEYELILEYEAKKRRAESTGISTAGGSSYSGYQQSYSDAYARAFAGRQGGGYVGAGVYAMGEAGREFVLSNSATSAAERILGPLTQGSIMNAIGARNVTNNFAPTFNFSERDDAQMILGQVQQMVRGEMLRIERGY